MLESGFKDDLGFLSQAAWARQQLSQNMLCRHYTYVPDRNRKTILSGEHISHGTLVTPSPRDGHQKNVHQSMGKADLRSVGEAIAGPFDDGEQVRELRIQD